MSSRESEVTPFDSQNANCFPPPEPLLHAAELCLQGQRLLHAAASHVDHWQQRRLLRSWGAGLAFLSAAIARLHQATEGGQ